MWIVLAVLAYFWYQGSLKVSQPTVTSGANGSAASESVVLDNTPLGNARVDVMWDFNSPSTPGTPGTRAMYPLTPAPQATPMYQPEQGFFSSHLTR